MSMLTQQPPQGTGYEQPPRQPERFRALTAELEEYEHLPELAPSVNHPTQLITSQSHEETLDESILAGLTLP